MPRRSGLYRVRDILEATEKILEYTEGMDYEQFREDERTVDAVLRNFTVLGEAARHTDEETMSRQPDLPWADMRDMRNLVVHEYFGVSLEIVWQTIIGDLPAILEPLQALSEDLSRN